MRRYEITLASGRTITQDAGDSWEALCLAAARLRVKVESFRSFRWVNSEQEVQR